MRILYLSHLVPVPDATGDLRHYRFVKGLSGEHAVRLLIGAREVAWTDDDLRRLDGTVEEVDILSLNGRAASRSRRLANRALRAMSSRVTPWWLDEEFEEAVIGAIHDFGPDVIHANMPTIKHCPRIRDVPIVVDLCDAVSLQAQLRGGPVRAWWWLRGYREMEAFAGSVARKVIVISERDARAINCPPEKTAVVPNGVDLEYYSPSDQPYGRYTVCFVGAMDYLPNVDAALHFAHEVWPLVLEVLPEAVALLVGRNPDPRVRQLDGEQGITVTGTVDDVRPFVWRSAATIAPLRYASGMQNKVLQSLAMGVPCVLTPAANGGIGAGAEQGVLTASDPDGLANALVGLMRNPDERARLGSLGRRYVESTFAWEQAIERLVGVYREALEDA